GGGACEAGTVAAPRVLAFTNELRRDHHWLGHAVEGQVAGDVGSAFTGGLDASGLEGRGRVLAHIEEVVTAQVLVALGMVGVDAGSLQGDFDLAGFRLSGVEAEAAIKVLEGAMHVTEAQVASLEVDEGVLAGFINGVVSGQGLACEQGRTQSQGGEGFLQHEAVSLGTESNHWSARPNMRFRVGSRSMK